MASDPESHTRRLASFQSAARIASVLTIAIGVIVLLGWLFQIELLKSILPIWISMKANTALAFILAGVALRLYQQGSSGRAPERIAQSCGLFVALLGLLTLGEYWFGFDLGIDQLLFREPVGTVGTSHPGRMAVPTAIDFVLLGWALFFYRKRSVSLVQIPVLLASSIALLGVAGYLYHAEGLQRMGPNFIAIHTALAFLILAAGMLLSEPDSGLMRWVTHADAGGVMLRQLLPVIVVIPIGLGGVILAGIRLGLYPVETGWSLFALATVVTLVVFISRNAEQLHRVDQALRENERKFALMFEKAAYAVALARLPECNLVDINEAWVEVFGYTRQEAVGKTILELNIHPDPEAHAGMIAQLQERGSVRDREAPLRTRSGEWRVFSLNIDLVDIAGEQYVLNAAQDITERKRAEEELIRYREHLESLVRERTTELKASEERFRRLAENAQDLIYRYRLMPVRGFEYVSPAATRITGYTPEEHYADPDLGFKLVHPDDRPKLEAAARGAKSSGEPIIIRWIRRDGKTIWTEQHNVPVMDDTGNIIAIECIARDITIRKQAEQALRKSEKQSRELSVTAQRQAQELSLLDEVRTAISQELDLSVILYTVVEAIAHAFDYQFVSLYLIEGDRLILQHQVGYERTIAQIPLGAGVTSRAISTRQPVLLENVRDDPAFLGAIEGIVSEIALPLFHREEVVGVLNVESTQGVRLTENDLNLLIALGQSINIAFQRAKLHHEVRESEERFRTSVETLLDGFAILSAVRDENGQIIDFCYEYINEAGCQLNHRPREEHIGYSILKVLPGHADAGLIAEYAHLVESGQPISKEEFQYEDIFGAGQKLSRVFDVRAVKLGDGLAITWRDVTERKQMELAEHEQRDLAEALADTAAALTSTVHLNEVFDRILANVGRVVPHENANIMLVEEGVARIVGGLGYSEAELERVRTIRLPVAQIPSLICMSETGQPLIIPDTTTHAGWVDVPETRWIRSYAGAPIQVKGRTVGFINLNAAAPRYFEEEHAQRLQAFAHQAAIAVENAQLYAQTQQLAITDELTGVYNRRGFFELGRREVDRAVRSGHILSALILDIDHFKAVNDTYGHATGDQVLQNLAKRCLTHIREIDILGRYGGEEFVILLPESNLMNAEKVAERLRKLVASEPFPTRQGNIEITISLGVSSVSEQAEDLAALIERADLALYIAKRSGRNQVASLQADNATAADQRQEPRDVDLQPAA